MGDGTTLPKKVRGEIVSFIVGLPLVAAALYLTQSQVSDHVMFFSQFARRIRGLNPNLGESYVSFFAVACAVAALWTVGKVTLNIRRFNFTRIFWYVSGFFVAWFLFAVAVSPAQQRSSHFDGNGKPLFNYTRHEDGTLELLSLEAKFDGQGRPTKELTTMIDVEFLEKQRKMGPTEPSYPYFTSDGKPRFVYTRKADGTIKLLPLDVEIDGYGRRTMPITTEVVEKYDSQNAERKAQEIARKAVAVAQPSPFPSSTPTTTTATPQESYAGVHRIYTREQTPAPTPLPTTPTRVPSPPLATQIAELDAQPKIVRVAQLDQLEFTAHDCERVLFIWCNITVKNTATTPIFFGVPCTERWESSGYPKMAAIGRVYRANGCGFDQGHLTTRVIHMEIQPGTTTDVTVRFDDVPEAVRFLSRLELSFTTTNDLYETNEIRFSGIPIKYPLK